MGNYRARAIISRGLYIFIPFFTAVLNQDWLILQTIYVLNKEILLKNPRFIIKSGFKSRAGYIGANTVCKYCTKLTSGIKIIKSYSYLSYFHRQTKNKHQTIT
jgi:hypothetical protein